MHYTLDVYNNSRDFPEGVVALKFNLSGRSDGYLDDKWGTIFRDISVTGNDFSTTPPLVDSTRWTMYDSHLGIDSVQSFTLCSQFMNTAEASVNIKLEEIESISELFDLSI